ncbi:MAG: hypothetical protein WAN72_11550 [Candidatus Acidiferrales bacterium]
MQRQVLRTIAFAGIALLAILTMAPRPAQAQDAKTLYPQMAPLDQYLITDRNTEIELARSAAPETIAREAEVMVLTRHGYETAAKGTNGFVCIVERSWTADSDDPDFWNPKLRAPICFNPPAARTYLPLTIKKTDLVVAGKSKEEMFEGIKAGFDKKELPTLEPGAMAYMLSKQGYLGDSAGHWHPHVMFFVSDIDAATLGANVTGSPLLASPDKPDRLTVILIPVGKWSDGSAAPMFEQ